MDTFCSIPIPYRPFGLNFSSPFSQDESVAITSFTKSESNFIKTFKIGLCGPEAFVEIPITFPQTRVMFSPTAQPEANLITSGDCLRIFTATDTSIDLITEISVNDSADPVTCFDWVPEDDTQIICGSTDATATAIDISTGQPTAKLIAHDHPVHDICYFGNASTFVTAGFDGSLRFFDLRDQMSSFIYFQTAMPLLRCCVCPPNLVAVFAKDSLSATIIDTRRPCMPCGFGHQGTAQITGVAWSQIKPETIITSDANGLLAELDTTTGEDRVLIEGTGVPIESIALRNEKIALGYNQKVDVLQFI